MRVSFRGITSVVSPADTGAVTATLRQAWAQVRPSWAMKVQPSQPLTDIATVVTGLAETGVTLTRPNINMPATVEPASLNSMTLTPSLMQKSRTSEVHLCAKSTARSSQDHTPTWRV